MHWHIYLHDYLAAVESRSVSDGVALISIGMITEGVETLEGFRGPLTAEVAADLKWFHVSVEESYMTKVICDSFATSKTDSPADQCPDSS